MNPEQFAVYVQDACKSYGKNKILNKLCMRVNKGSIYGLLGASGCGKTTLLNAIVGRKEIDSGEILTLGGKPGEPNSGVPGPRVGYMPQNLALVAEFTVKDAVYYFGRIMNMDTSLIEKRFNDLCNLLDLPPEDRYLKNCSGGQQRRVSFAAAIIHMPELVILDEPTAGVDPVIRERIWNYLVEITQEYRMAIIITTHYIDEAKQANKIGLKREGRLLAEESPATLLRVFQKETLEDVFLVLSKRQEEGKLDELAAICGSENSVQMDLTGSTATMSTIGGDQGSTDQLTRNEIPKKLKKLDRMIGFKKHRVMTLFDKNWKQFYRNITGVIFLFFFPALQTSVIFSAVGWDIQNIPIAVVNNETMSCWNFTKNGTAVIDANDECHFQNFSCRFLSYLDDPMLKLVNYDTPDEAKVDIGHGKVVGVMYMSANFSESLSERITFGKDIDAGALNTSSIKVWMDMSNRQIGATIQFKLASLYLKFQKDVIKDCKYLPGIANLPMNFDDYAYGHIEEPYIIYMLPPTLLTVVFFMGSITTALIMITERFEGIWDRTIVAGVTTLEVSLTHFLLQAALCVLQVFEIMLLAFWIFKMPHAGSLAVIWLFLYAQAIVGMSYGLLVSSISVNYSMANFVITGSFLPMILVCGFVWPLESAPKVLQFISRCLPFTVPIEALRNVTKRDWPLSDFKVWIGLLIPAIWTVVFIALSLWATKRRR